MILDTDCADMHSRFSIRRLQHLRVTVGLSLAAAAFAMHANQALANPTPACSKLLQHVFPRLQDDAPQSLCQYAGRVVLVVNTASYCGYTRQYTGLEKLFEEYKGKGLVILGFPANNFGAQEPGNAQQIGELCFNTYGVKFPMFSKSDVVGNRRNALYKALSERTGDAPAWNFHKYLIDRRGQSIRSFASAIEPSDPKLIQAIESALAATP